MGKPFMVMEPSPHIYVPANMVNGMSGRTGGVEMTATYQPTSFWRLAGSLTTFSDSLDSPSFMDSFGRSSVIEGQGSTPRFQAVLKSHLQCTNDLSFDLGILHNGEIAANYYPAYTRFDAQLSYNVKTDLQLSLIGRDIFGKSRQESGGSLFEVPSATERSWSMKLTYKF